MSAIAVSSLHIYPVKSCGGLTVTDAVVTPRGFRFDRPWMFVDDRGMFVAQRSGRGLGTAVTSVCLVRTALTNGTLTLTAPSMPPLAIPLDGNGVEIPVTVWDDRVREREGSGTVTAGIQWVNRALVTTVTLAACRS